MSKEMVEKRASALAKNKRHRLWRRVVGVLGCVAVFCTVYALVLPAITKTTETYCGLEGHTHGNACYQQQLACGQTESKDTVIKGHAHSAACYQTERNLICTLEESEDVLDENGEVLEPGHLHGEACYETADVLVCKTAESADEVIKGHTHGSACYKKAMTCEKKEHLHTSKCYSNPKADLETAEDWEKTLPKDEEMTEEWDEDVLLVADSQLGYAESQSNYVVDEAAGYNRGYTRYGDWYGDPYGDWCAMFVSFCLHYAGVDEELMPRDANCQNWINTLKKDEWGLWRPVVNEKGKAVTPAEVLKKQAAKEDGESKTEFKDQKYNPKPGDLVFFNWDTDSEVSDHIGFVYETIPATEEEPAKLKTIEGNASDRVEYVTYELDDPSIMGYAQLPENPEPSKAEREAAQKAAAETAEEPAAESAAKASRAAVMAASDVEPVAEDITHDQMSGLGKYVHMSKYRVYQGSAEYLGGLDIEAFALIPAEEYSPAWKPNTIEWSAKADANYIAAFCADKSTMINFGESAEYNGLTVDNSRFSTDEVRRQLAGVIAHSYPFLTYEEMQAELKAAYNRGELKVDVSGCGKSEMLAAAQAAIWKAAAPESVDLSFTHGGIHDVVTALSINPLVKADLIHTNNTEVSSHCRAIAEWLLTQSVPEDLKVATYDYTVEKDEYGLYTLTVNATFNRAVVAGEMVDMKLIAGSSSTDSVRLSAGQDEFSVSLSGLTREEILSSVVSLDITGSKMQAYYFDSVEFQDMIGGLWENYSHDLSFRVTADSTSVSVSKHWTEDKPVVDSVMVKLFANGTQVGDPVELSAKNDWAYTWYDLGKYDSLGNPIKYSVQEVPVPGCYSSVAELEGGKTTMKVWEEADNFQDGGQYMLVARTGALGTISKDKLSWRPVTLQDAQNTGSDIIWTAHKADGSNGFYLSNASVGQSLRFGSVSGSPNEVFLTSDKSRWVPLHITGEGRLATQSNLYFINLTWGFQLDMRNSSSAAMPLTLYKLVEKEVPSSEFVFVITNTKSDEDVEPVEVVVNKDWMGREDDRYPGKATVQLLQNGQPYGDPVDLSAENEWSASWTELPKTDNDGKPFEYTVAENPVEGYASTQKATFKNGVWTIALTNTWNPEKARVILQKVDADDPVVLLPGAEFDLYLVSTDEDDPLVPGTTGVHGVKQDPVVVGQDGKVELSLAANEDYCLVETKAPAGYNLLDSPVGFSISVRGELVKVNLFDGSAWATAESGNPAVITVKNGSGFELPETGGAGSAPFMLAGTMFICAGMFLLIRRMQRGKRGA